jgi:endonuclease YncB( thermonuclease family)
LTFPGIASFAVLRQNMTAMRLLPCLLLTPALALAHGGGLDAYGCHHNRKAGGYHCHHGELAGMAFSSQAEMLRAMRAKQAPKTEAAAKPLAAVLEQFTGRVISVADGDTITVLTQDKQHVKIRLYGISCPKSGQPFGARAKQVTSDAVFGKNVTVQPMGTERHDQVAAIVSIPGDRPLHESLVSGGMAWVYPQCCTREVLCGPLRRLETGAKAMKRGLWADKNPTPPWEWRKNDARYP